MRALLKESLASPVYLRESGARGCRTRGIGIVLGIEVGMFYLAMILLIAAALEPDNLPAILGMTWLLAGVSDIGARILGVLLLGDSVAGERSLRTLEPLLLSPAPRPAIVLAKLLARLRPLKPLVFAIVPGLVVFPPAISYLIAPHVAAAAPAMGGTPITFAGLTATLYVVTLYPFVSIASSLFLGASIGIFFSTAIRDHGLALALAFGAVLLLSIGFCVLSYFMSVFGMLGGMLSAQVHAALGVIPALLVVLEEFVARAGPAGLLLWWLASDFDRLAAE